MLLGACVYGKGMRKMGKAWAGPDVQTHFMKGAKGILAVGFHRHLGGSAHFSALPVTLALCDEARRRENLYENRSRSMRKVRARWPCLRCCLDV